ncbi:MAG: T9SS type A sorting domain-containing protein [Microscillaceae bacterium]|nr:T9SS type A sorting domain-containing protein [Microscillaceae bacterium]
MVLSGPLSHTQTESILPYALFGDNPPGNYNGRNFVPGDYSLTLTPYSGPKLSGVAGSAFVLNFSLRLPLPALNTLNLIDAQNDVVIGPLSNGQVLNSTDFSNLFFSVEALGNALVGSVYFELSGPLSRTATENLPPYALYGDTNGGTNYLGANFLSGSYTLRATPYAGDNRSGAQGTPIEISFTLNVPNEPSVLSVTLVNAQSNADIRVMIPGEVLDLGQLPSALSIRANANGTLTESVRFVLKKDGQTLINRIENIEPYALLGDNPSGNYNDWTPGNGQYELLLTPYASNNATGQAGAVLVLPFEVINAPVSRAVAQAQYPDEVSESGQVEWRKSYPNPLTGSVLEVEMSEVLKGQAVWELSDVQGRVLYQGRLEAEGRQRLKLTDLPANLPQGTYFLHLRADNLPHTGRRIVKAN